MTLVEWLKLAGGLAGAGVVALLVSALFSRPRVVRPAADLKANEDALAKAVRDAEQKAQPLIDAPHAMTADERIARARELANKGTRL